VETAGRWSRTHGRPPIPDEQIAEAIAWQLLRRYGVVFRRLVQRESLLAPWRDILRVYRRLEARGEIRGGRFVGGFSGEQYALPEAIGLLRTTRREQGAGELVALSGADPLNLVGILTPGEAVPAITSNRVLYRDGVPVVVKEGEGKGERFLVEVPNEERDVLRAALMRRRPAPLVRAYMGKSRAS
jgi:ATP-dependent Lhr-like helicase